MIEMLNIDNNIHNVCNEIHKSVMIIIYKRILPFGLARVQTSEGPESGKHLVTNIISSLEASQEDETNDEAGCCDQSTYCKSKVLLQ